MLNEMKRIVRVVSSTDAPCASAHPTFGLSYGFDDIDLSQVRSLYNRITPKLKTATYSGS